MGCSSGSNARYLRVLVGLRAPSDALTPCELVNSVMISPHPPRFRIKRRKTVSVTPAIGAKTVAGEIFSAPIENSLGKRCIALWFHSTGLRSGNGTAGRSVTWLWEKRRMKPLQIALLLIAGGLGGTVVMRVLDHPQQSTPPPSSAVQKAETRLPVAPPPAPVPEPAATQPRAAEAPSSSAVVSSPVPPRRAPAPPVRSRQLTLPRESYAPPARRTEAPIIARSEQAPVIQPS